MSIKIGRVGTDGIVLPDPDISYSAEQVTLSGTYTPPAGSSTAVADTLWLREQILGLAGNDAEPIVPVVWSARPEFADELDGFYRVTDAQASFPVGSLNAEAPFLQWSVTLERSLDYRQPRIQISGVRGLLSNSLGLSCDSVSAAPSAALDFDPGFNTGTTMLTRVADTGNLQVGLVADNSTIGTTYTGSLSIEAAYYYAGACRAQTDVSGAGVWRDVVGRRAVTSSEFNNNQFRFGNGLVRVAVGAVSLLSVSWYDGSAWSTPTRFDVHETGLSSRVVGTTARILRLGPEEIGVRLHGHLSGSVTGVVVDVALRRGLRHVFVKPSYLSNLFWQLRFSSVTASTSLTGGLRRTSNNGDGDREILISDTATTKDTTNGWLSLPSAAPSAKFGIGLELGGSAAAGQDTAANQVQEWFSAQSETQRVVAG